MGSPGVPVDAGRGVADAGSPWLSREGTGNRRAAYLDHAATTPLRPEAREAWLAAPEGNPSSGHSVGRAAREALESARDLMADVLGVHPFDIVLTSGGTLADNLAVRGIHAARHAGDPRRDTVVISAIEHPAVRQSAAAAVDADLGGTGGGGARVSGDEVRVTQGARGSVAELPVDPDGRVDLPMALDYLATSHERISVMSVMSANNEVGTVQPIEELAGAAAEWGIPVHFDAVQSVGWWGLPEVPGAAVSISGHKFGAPVGVGALVLPADIPCRPLLLGGGQERALHSGTLDVRGAAALAAALRAARGSQEASGEKDIRLPQLRDQLAAVLSQAGGRVVTPSTGVLPGIVGAVFPGCQADALLLLLDEAGVACSAGSACSAGVARPSRVVMQMGLGEVDAMAFLRFSLGWTSTRADLDLLAAALPGAVDRARAALHAWEVRR